VVEANTAALAFTELRFREMDMMLGRISNQTLDDDLHGHHLFDESLLVVAGNQNDWAHNSNNDFADLVDKPWILSPPENAIYTLVEVAFRSCGLKMPSVSIATWSMTLRLQLLSDGPYVTVFPASLVRHNAKRWNLKALPVRLDERLPVAIVTLKHRTQSAAPRVFIEHARAVSMKLRQQEL
jgi:DNA-binding transcriptional LysR family regulator